MFRPAPLRTLAAVAIIAASAAPARASGCRPDFTGDCAVTPADVAAFLDAYAAADPAADLDASGAINVQDVRAFFILYAAGCTLDNDFDRIPDAFETNNGLPSGPCDTGTDPNHPDTDRDGLTDGDEVYGTLDGLDLPALGASPLRRDVFVEADWTDDAHEAPAHSHRPTPAVAAKIVDAFAAAPVSNPYRLPDGISVHLDYGQGAPFTGGNLIPGSPIVIVFDAGFNVYKANHFAANRKGYFHYAIFAHRYNNPINDSSGIAEILGDDFMVTLYTFYANDDFVANTGAHEMGHNMGLRHGGFEERNGKPNYNSVMNYRFQFTGIDTDCDARGDGPLDFSPGGRLTLNELSLNETAGVCGAPAGIDWNESGGPLQTGVARNINCYAPDSAACGSNPFGRCFDSACTVLLDSNDWSRLVYATLQGGDSLSEIVTCDAPPLH